jgi:hypothetical protein
MKSCFIIVRFDRMKNSDLNALFYQLTNDNFFEESSIPEINKAFNHLKELIPLTNVLHKKQRKKLYTKEITKLRAENDKLIAGLLFQIKALKYAQFEEQKSAMSECIWLVKHLKNYSRSLIFEKEVAIYFINSELDYKTKYKPAFTELGLMRYIDKFNETDAKINSLLEMQKLREAGKPAPNTTIPTKEKLIAEIRMYLKLIDAYKFIHPEVDISNHVNGINFFLKQARTQLRNTTTRRIRKKEKENTPIT